MKKISVLNSKQKNPFLVPEHYLETFAERMMSRIPEDEVMSERNVLPAQGFRSFLYYAAAAVMVGVLFLGTGIYRQSHTVDDTANDGYLSAYYSENEADFTYDYLMLDNNNVYEYATTDE